MGVVKVTTTPYTLGVGKYTVHKGLAKWNMKKTVNGWELMKMGCTNGGYLKWMAYA